MHLTNEIVARTPHRPETVRGGYKKRASRATRGKCSFLRRGSERKEESHGSPYSELVGGRPSLLWKPRVHLCCWRRRVRDRVANVFLEEGGLCPHNNTRARRLVTGSLAGWCVLSGVFSLALCSRTALFGVLVSPVRLCVLHSNCHMSRPNYTHETTHNSGRF